MNDVNDAEITQSLAVSLHARGAEHGKAASFDWLRPLRLGRKRISPRNTPTIFEDFESRLKCHQRWVVVHEGMFTYEVVKRLPIHRLLFQLHQPLREWNNRKGVALQERFDVLNRLTPLHRARVSQVKHVWQAVLEHDQVQVSARDCVGGNPRDSLEYMRNQPVFKHQYNCKTNPMKVEGVLQKLL